MTTVADSLTAPDFATLTSRAKAQGLLIVEATWHRALPGWTAWTRPMTPASERTYRVDGLSTVTLGKEAGVYTGRVDGVRVPYGEACRVMATATHLRLLDEVPALTLSNPVSGAVAVPVRVGA